MIKQSTSLQLLVLALGSDAENCDTIDCAHQLSNSLTLKKQAEKEKRNSM